MPSKYINKLEGRLIIVLGGTSGIGYAVAEACIEHGARIVVSSRLQENVDKAIEGLKAAYPDAASHIRGQTCNLSSEDCEQEIVSLFDFASQRGAQPVDHVVNTAGEPGAMGTALQDTSAEDMVKRYRGGLVPVALVAKVASMYLRPASTSSYTMTSGLLAYRPRKGMGIGLLAGGSKEQLMRGLAVDLAPIRCNVVSPGAIHTPLLQRIYAAMGGEEAARSVFKAGTLVNEVGTPEDCAEAYLCSIKNNFMTGQVIHAEGGALLKSG
jgi:NAD(P)-dependent dehydrogenase (short-subunit alcohol dehydrogenase family)